MRGYRVMNTVSATMDDIERVGTRDRRGAGGGGQPRARRALRAARPAGVPRSSAIDDAVRRARADAEALAAALGLGLGMVREAYTADVGDRCGRR